MKERLKALIMLLMLVAFSTLAACGSGDYASGTNNSDTVGAAGQHAADQDNGQGGQ
jgi:major membrane immunogen (membrane-anchored lipoprotein)